MTKSRGLSQKVLVVDDDEDLRSIVMDVLKIHGFAPLGAPDGLSAIAMVGKEPPNAVILDLNMPGINGIETLIELKKIAPCLPVVVLTANGDIPVIVKAMQAGAFNFITKPPVFEYLICIINEATKGSCASTLTVREMEVLGWIKQGKSNPEIAKLTYLSENTVRTHLKKIFIKLGVQSRGQALRVAFQKGILQF